MTEPSTEDADVREVSSVEIVPKRRSIHALRKHRRSPESHKTDAGEHVTAGASSASLSATSSVMPLAAAAGASSGRFFLGAGAFLTQQHGGTRRCASPSYFPIISMLRQALT